MSLYPFVAACLRPDDPALPDDLRAACLCGGKRYEHADTLGGGIATGPCTHCAGCDRFRLGGLDADVAAVRAAMDVEFAWAEVA